ncbi:MAG: PEP-CTERM system TPR-repeat protein PrsT [Candidatus Polarisedimenticolaceae bacterium]|nr:PEP-CTERM system TPR-repeat protein PrsT [Candidatus Polarisedimenticolaceae bacterium]
MKQIISALFILALLSGCDGLFNELSDAEHVSKAQTYLDEGKLASASIELKNALSKNSDNAQAHWLLGKLHVETGDGLSAEKELTRAKELGVNDDAVLPLLLEALLLQENYSGVLKQDISSVRADEIIARLKASRGLALLSQKEADKARQELDAALLLGSDLPYVLTARAHLSAVERDIEEARSYLDKALVQNSTYAPAWSLQGGLVSTSDELEKSVEAYTKAIDNRFNNGGDLLKRAFLLIQLKRYEEAQSDLSLLKARFPKHPGVNYVQGALYFNQKRFPEAQESLELVLKGNNDEMMAIFYLGATHFLQGNYEQAENYLSRFVTIAPGYIPGRMLLAQIRLNNREFAEAEALMRPVVKSIPKNIQALNILANALIYQGKTDEAIALLEKVVKLQPEMAEARMRLGTGLLSKGEKERGFKSLEDAIEIDPQFQQADIILVLNHLKDNDIDGALKAAKSFVSRQPKNAVAHNMLGLSYLASKQIIEAEKAFQTAIKQAPGDPEANRQLAIIALKDEHYAEALGYLEEVLKHHPAHIQTLMSMAGIEAMQGRTKEEEKILLEVITSNPESVAPRVLLSRKYLKEKRVDRARSVLGEILEKERNTPAVLAVLGEIQLTLRDYKSAESTLKQLTQLQPEMAQAHFLLAKAYKGLNDHESQKRSLEEALKIAPKHAAANVDYIRVLISEGDIAGSKELLEKSKTTIKDDVTLLSLEGAILLEMKEFEKALPLYLEMYSKKANSKTLLALVKIYEQMGKQSDSLPYLESWIKDYPKDVSARLITATIYIEKGREADAISQYREVLNYSKDNTIALNNLAWYLRKTDPDKALAYAEKAHISNRASVTVMDTLAMLVSQNGDTARAQRLIERALAQQPMNPTLIYHRAQILEKAGQIQEAKTSLETLLEKDLEFPEKVEAGQMLKRLSAL